MSEPQKFCSDCKYMIPENEFVSLCSHPAATIVSPVNRSKKYRTCGTERLTYHSHDNSCGENAKRFEQRDISIPPKLGKTESLMKFFGYVKLKE